MKKLIDNSTITVGEFNTPSTGMDRSSKQKINKETMAINDTLDQMNLTDIFRTFILKQQNARSSPVHMEHSPEQITYQATIKSQQIHKSQSHKRHLFWTKEKKSGKSTNTWKLNNMLLNNEWINQEIKEETKDHMETK